jgi:P-type Ca2+ transporter type 2C
MEVGSVAPGPDLPAGGVRRTDPGEADGKMSARRRTMGPAGGVEIPSRSDGDDPGIASTPLGAAAEPWTASAEAVAADLAVDPSVGLGTAELEARLRSWGPNELRRQRSTGPVRLLLHQFANTLIIVLCVAAAVTAALGEIRDTAVILAIVVLNAVIGFVQEHRAERALEALQRVTAAHANVVRGGVRLTVSAAEVVPGDVIALEAGDVVAADGRLVTAPGLRVDEATLTGESVPVDKSVDPLPIEQGGMVGDRSNMVWKGTAVVHGRGSAVVTATGMGTALGRIAGMLEGRPSTPLQRRLAVLGRRLAGAAVVVCVVVFAAGIARGEPASLMFLTAVSLAVAAIPESLPAVVTVSLAIGAQRMARQRALVRKLPAVETLGSVTVICTDKTGTLTQGRMQVERVWTPELEVEVRGDGYAPEGALLVAGARIDPTTNPRLLALLEACSLCNDAALVPVAGAEDAAPTWEVLGDPTEGALLGLVAKSGLQASELVRAHPRVLEAAFDSVRRRMTTIHHTPAGDVLVTCKGAPEAVLEVVAGSGLERDAVRATAASFAARGFRVLALASRRVAAVPVRPEDAERDLDLLGLVAMADPVRAESAAAVTAARAAGIRPVMITGDHPATARAIAGDLGLLDGRSVVTGRDLDLGPEGVDVADVAVFARTSPEQKLDIVRAWQERGQVVAMTGDGVNDAPALVRADIGVAMGRSGSEVAKEAADLVLADDDFASIVLAVSEGRRIYDNIRRFVRYTMTSNTGEIWVMLLGPFVGLPLPLLPVHILWINLVTDGLPGLALGLEAAERDVMRRPPRRTGESIFARGLWQHVGWVGGLMAGTTLAVGGWAHATGRPWQTMVFTTLALLQLGHALAVRSESDSLRRLGLWSNTPLIAAVAGTLVLQLAVIYWSPAQLLLRTEALGLVDLAVVLSASGVVLVAVEIEKALQRRRRRTGMAGRLRAE